MFKVWMSNSCFAAIRQCFEVCTKRDSPHECACICGQRFVIRLGVSRPCSASIGPAENRKAEFLPIRGLSVGDPFSLRPWPSVQVSPAKGVVMADQLGPGVRHFGSCSILCCNNTCGHRFRLGFPAL